MQKQIVKHTIYDNLTIISRESSLSFGGPPEKSIPAQTKMYLKRSIKITETKTRIYSPTKKQYT